MRMRKLEAARYLQGERVQANDRLDREEDFSEARLKVAKLGHVTVVLLMSVVSSLPSSSSESNVAVVKWVLLLLVLSVVLLCFLIFKHVSSRHFFLRL